LTEDPAAPSCSPNAVARRILLRLVSFGEGRADTRRQQPRAALRAIEDTAANFETVMRRLIEARLLTVDGDPDHDGVYVDLAHEVMISAWPTLARWIQIWRVDEQRRRQVEAAAAAWCTRGKGAGGLLDAIELAELPGEQPRPRESSARAPRLRHLSPRARLPYARRRSIARAGRSSRPPR
jgi:hypothetical protein